MAPTGILVGSSFLFLRSTPGPAPEGIGRSAGEDDTESESEQSLTPPAPRGKGRWAALPGSKTLVCFHRRQRPPCSGEATGLWTHTMETRPERRNAFTHRREPQNQEGQHGPPETHQEKTEISQGLKRSLSKLSFAFS